MVSTATTRNRFNKQGTGDNTNTWGTKLNGEVFDLIDEALDGYVAVTVSGDVTLTSTNYVTDQARMRQLWLSGTGGYTVTLPGVQKFYLVRNDCSAAVVFSNGGVTASVAAGQVQIVVTNGTDCYATAHLPLAGGTLTGALTLSADAASALQPATLQQLQAAVLSAAAGNLPALTGNTLKFLRVNAGETAIEWAAATLASLGASANGVSLVSAADYAAMRALLDLEAGTDFYSISGADAQFYSKAQTDAAFQPLDADLTALAAIGGVQGDIIYRNASSWVRLGAGTAGQFLKTNGASANPEWATVAGGAMFTDPDRFAKWQPNSANLSDGTNVATAAAFFSGMDDQGVHVDTDFTADTYKTIASISGAGEMIGAVGPTAGGAETTTFRITVDGVVTAVAVLIASGDRAFLGPLSHLDQAVAGTGVPWTGDQDDLDGTKRISNPGSLDKFVFSSTAARAYGLPRLRFETSLLVEMKHSANVTATASRERRAGVFYVLD